MNSMYIILFLVSWIYYPSYTSDMKSDTLKHEFTKELLCKVSFIMKDIVYKTPEMKHINLMIRPNKRLDMVAEFLIRYDTSFVDKKVDKINVNIIDSIQCGEDSIFYFEKLPFELVVTFGELDMFNEYTKGRRVYNPPSNRYGNVSISNLYRFSTDECFFIMEYDSNRKHGFGSRMYYIPVEFDIKAGYFNVEHDKRELLMNNVVQVLYDLKTNK